MVHSFGGRRRLRALLLAVALVGVACSGDDSADDAAQDGSGADSGDDAEAAAAVEPEAFEGADFYELPEPLPQGEPGTLLRYEPMESYDVVAGAEAWRIMYLSESLEGDPIAVTGSALVPREPAPDEEHKLLTISHGTTGIADECAPSLDPTATEMSLTGEFVEAGYVVVMSDYEGLGTPGRHPYLVGESEGRSVLDAAKAVRSLPGTEIGDRYAISGYSQGGHGALWAHQLAGDWGPDDMELVGTVAGAPATEMPVIFAAGDAVRGFFIAMVAGYEAAYPEADPSLVLSDTGLGMLDAVDEGCIGDIFAATAGGEGSVVIPEHGTVEPWASLMAENDPGQMAVDEPVLIVHSQADTTVPPGLVESLAERMCGEDQVVERRAYDRGQSHGEAVPDAYADGFEWIEGLMAGDDPVSTCS